MKKKIKKNTIIAERELIDSLRLCAQELILVDVAVAAVQPSPTASPCHAMYCTTYNICGALGGAFARKKIRSSTAFCSSYSEISRTKKNEGYWIIFQHQTILPSSFHVTSARARSSWLTYFVVVKKYSVLHFSANCIISGGLGVPNRTGKLCLRCTIIQ